MSQDDSVLVFSTDSGRVKPSPEQPQTPTTDGIVRLARQTKGRKGKGVVIIEGLGLNEKELKQLAKTLKQKCACGGSVKGFDIEIQTDDREKLKAILEKMGHVVKLKGG